MPEHSDEYRKPSMDALRDSIARAIESVPHDLGSRPCEPSVETADAVLGDWLRLVDEHLQAHLIDNKEDNT